MASEAPAPDALAPPLPALYQQAGWCRASLQIAVVLSLALVGASAGLVTANTKTSAVYNTNVGSRYGQVEGLVNHGTYAITKTRYKRTIDAVFLDGEKISSKPPLLPTVTAGVYWVFRTVTGYDIRTDEHKVVGFCNLVMGAFLHVIMLVFWLRWLLLITDRVDVVLLSVSGMAFGFLGMGYAVELNNHSVSACLTTVGFYFAYRVRNGLDAKPWHWRLCGFLLGILPAVDVPSGLTSAGIFVYLATADLKRTLTHWLPFALIGPALAMFLNYQVTGSVLPVQLQPELKKGSYWEKPKGVDALREPKHIYGFNLTLGHHGLFSMTPILVFGLSWAGRKLAEAKHAFAARRASGLNLAEAGDGATAWPQHLAETLLCAGVCLGLLGFYIKRTRNYGGNCVGFRWAIAWTPLLMALVAFYLTRIRITVFFVLVWAGAVGFTMFHNWEILTFTAWHNSGWQWFIQAVFPSWLVGVRV
jgi:hypothetical protein